MAEVDGKLMVLQFDNVAIVGRTTGSMNSTADMLDATTADSAGWKEFVAGEKNLTLSVGGLYDPDAAEGVSEALANLWQGNTLTWKFGQTGTGQTYWTGTGLLSSVSIQGDKNTLTSYSIEIQNTGTPEELTVSGS